MSHWAAMEYLSGVLKFGTNICPFALDVLEQA